MKHNLIKIAAVTTISGAICLWQTPARAEVSGADKEFLKNQAKEHEAAIKLFETEAKKGGDPEVKAWAEKMIPGLKSHLLMAKGGQEGQGGEGKKAGGEAKKGGGGEKAKGEKSGGNQ